MGKKKLRQKEWEIERKRAVACAICSPLPKSSKSMMMHL